MKESVLSMKEKTTTPLFFLLSNCSQILNTFYDWAVKYYCWWFWYM